MAAPRGRKPDPLVLVDDENETIGDVIAGADAAGAAAQTHHTYPIGRLHLTYNGLGGAGTGGPRTDWLQEAGDQWIKMHHPHLHYTRLQKWANANNVDLLFTTPYDFNAQPIENVWRDVKNDVALKYYPKRTIGETRDQLLHAFDTRITPELAQKLIRQSENEMMKMIERDELFDGLGRIGYFRDQPVLPECTEYIDLSNIEDHDDESSDDDNVI